jgi:putative membrane-bound dehydrogenase-like protein
VAGARLPAIHHFQELDFRCKKAFQEGAPHHDSRRIARTLANGPFAILVSLMPRTISLLVVSIICLSLASAAEFPTPYNSGTHGANPTLSPGQAVAALRLPDGFKATVFAAEPEVQNPISMAWDSRGRLWIAENYTYAERGVKFDLKLRDRVLVFEDRKGDGRFSSRRVFAADFQRLTSVEVGQGGVWLMCPPQLLFVPDRDQDGVPDGAAEVVLDGFTVPTENYHNFANGLRFGPDGWLYGRCGASSPGDLGVPGTAKEDRVPLRGTIWRFHPQRKVVEALGSGTTNPWGHDWDVHGELFFINTVNGHLWHSLTGGHYVRPHTIDPNPYAYGLIDMHADHWHFDTAQDWTKSRDGAANALGGGHAHGGMMIYQGDNWPDAYRGKLYTLNFHGRRANQEILEQRGAGYVAKHGKDTFISDDPWFRGIELSYGPDGGVFVLDWSDMGECHNSTGVNRTSGRIYKITNGNPRRNGPEDLTILNARELAALHTHANEWFARQARSELMSRATRSQALTDGIADLRELFGKHADAVVKLRALWTLYSLGAATPDFLRAQLRHENQHVRVWAIRLLSDEWPLDSVLSERPRRATAAPDAAVLREFTRLAESDSAGLVRLTLASALQRLPPNAREPLAAALSRRSEDAADPNLPLMIWYGLIPLAEANPAALARVGADCALPVTRRFVARRLAEAVERNPAPLDALIGAAASKDQNFQRDIVSGIAEGLAGWRRAPKPASWEAFATKLSGASVPAELQERVRELNLVFGDGRALEEVKALAQNGKAEVNARKAALRALIEARPPDLQKICGQLLRVRFLNTVAARGLALFDDPFVGEQLAAAYSSFHPSDRGVLIETLASRASFARALLAQIAAGRIPRQEVTPFHARQIRGFNDAALTQQLVQAWGELREPAPDKRAYIAKLKDEFTPAKLAGANRSRGRVHFKNLCSACHTLYGEGGALGPDLTGAGRDNLDYLLENIADPGAVVTADFRMCVIKMKDGRMLNGFIASRSARTLTIKSMSESQTIERADVSSIEETTQSIMPEGLLEALTAEERRDLIAYLSHPTQVPLP